MLEFLKKADRIIYGIFGTGDNVMNKIQKLQAKMPEKAAAIIEADFNRRYLTGFESSLGFLIVTKNDAVFLTDSRYIEKAQKTVANASVKEYFTLESVRDELNKTGAETVYLQSETTTVANAEKYRRLFDKQTLEFGSFLDSALNDIRSVKDDDEIEKIVAAQIIAEKAFEHILSFVKAGMTEKTVQLELDYYMLSHGAEALSFDTICVSGKNSSMPHGVPTDKKLESGDFLTLDFGATVDGYHSDMTRTFAIGKVNSEQRKVYETVLSAQTAVIDGVRDGMPSRTADALARDIIKEAGYGDFFRHGTGHGVGIEIHEFPALSEKCDAVLKTGMIVTAEPGIYLPDRFGVRIEDMILITENGCRNLTNAPKELIIV